MGNFLTGKNLENKLTDIIWNAKDYIVIVSPFIKLDDHVKNIFEKIKATHEVCIYLVFGKNEGYKQQSFNKSDYEYFKEFKNIAILYNKDLHAKHYCNEKEGLITSLNLYDYSMINNIEYGVHFSKTILNPTEKLFEETEKFTDELIFKTSEVVFLKKPQYKKKMLGLTKSYQNSTVLFDISENFFRSNNYEIKYLDDFDYENLSDIGKVFNKKPERAETNDANNNSSIIEDHPKTGYCIRTGEEIPFNPEKPYSYYAFKTWNQFGNPDYKENFCHKSGKESYGKTSMRTPILI